MMDTIVDLIFIFFSIFVMVAFGAGVSVFGLGVFYEDSEYIHKGCYVLIIAMMVLGIEIMLAQDYISKYSYEAELKDGSIVKVVDCYKKGNKNVCTLVDGDKKVVKDYWEIEK
ncbi:hypothetical protein MKC55_24360 [[Clostridium] innocuum]|nr:hypothetical protein [[Clostridium] innocuum]